MIVNIEDDDDDFYYNQSSTFGSYVNSESKEMGLQSEQRNQEKFSVSVAFKHYGSDSNSLIDLIIPLTADALMNAFSLTLKSADPFFLMVDNQPVFGGSQVVDIYEESEILVLPFPQDQLPQQVQYRAVVTQDFEGTSENGADTVRAGDIFDIFGAKPFFEEWYEGCLMGTDKRTIVYGQIIQKIPNKLDVLEVSIPNDEDTFTPVLFRQLRAKQGREAEEEDDITVTVGLLYDQVSEDIGGWIYVRDCEFNKIGLAPSKIFEPILFEATSDCSIVSSSDPAIVVRVVEGDLMELVQSPNIVALLLHDRKRHGIVGEIPVDLIKECNEIESKPNFGMFMQIAPEDDVLKMDSRTIEDLDSNMLVLKSTLEEILNSVDPDSALRSMFAKLEELIKMCKLGDQGELLSFIYDYYII